MTNVQKLTVEASELREALNTLAGDAEADETAINEKTAEYRRVEARLRAAIIAEGETREPVEPGGDAEARERDRLIGAADVRRYVSAGLRDRALEGAEAELNAALDCPDNRLPWEMLAEPEVRHRADTVTAAPSDVPRRPQRTIPRVFADSILQYLGVEMPRVAAGEAVYTHVTAGASPAPVASGVAKDAEAGTLTAITMKPIRFSAAYRYQVEDRALLASMPDVLRSDLRAALREELSDVALNGDGAKLTGGEATEKAPEGFIGSDALGTAPTDPTDAATFTNFRSLLISGVDGKHAYTLGGVRALLGVAGYKRAAAATDSALQTDALEFMARRGGGVRSTALITPASNIEQAVIFRAERGGGSAVFPMWQGVEIIEDRYTGASKGEVRLQLIALGNFKIVRTAAYGRAKLKVA
ncbi:MAG: hypothetical protein OXJ54_07975 [Gemmatimonadetes bacterium]|nr:hypothetical protein [Candidatus Palauibacter rhopaloidicola]